MAGIDRISGGRAYFLSSSSVHSIRLRQDIPDDLAVDIGQSVVAATMAIGKLLVIEAHQV